MSARNRLLAAWCVALGVTVPLRAGPADEAVKKVEEAGGVVRQATRGSDALEVDFQNSSGLTDAHLQHLHRLGAAAQPLLAEEGEAAEVVGGRDDLPAHPLPHRPVVVGEGELGPPPLADDVPEHDDGVQAAVPFVIQGRRILAILGPGS